MWLTEKCEYEQSDFEFKTSVVTAFEGTTPVYQRYKPFGETRLESTLGTKYTFTGQLSHTDDFGLLFFNARWVDPQLARFAQADSIVPDAYNPQDYDRYAYTRNNPLRYVDPSGHICLESTGGEICSEDIDSNGWWADTGASCRANPFQAMCYGVDQDGGEGLLKLVEFRESTGTIETQVGRDLVIGLGTIEIGITFADYSAIAMDNAPLTYKSIVWKIPNMVGGKYNIYEFTFVRGVSSGEVRNLGRALGDDLGGPVVFAVGYLLSVTPNIVENTLTNAPMGEHVYELAVDAAGFMGGELIGDSIQVPGSLAISPWAAVPVGVLADYVFGKLWDVIWYGGRN